MTRLTLQKKLAAKILKVGSSKVWLDPNQAKDIQTAITKADIRKLIQKGAVKALPEKVPFPKERKRRKRGPGRKRGSKYAKVVKKRRWIQTVRPLRRMLKELREKKLIDRPTYRKIYLLVKGGMFRSKSHLQIYLEQHGILKKK